MLFSVGSRSPCHTPPLCCASCSTSLCSWMLCLFICRKRFDILQLARHQTNIWLGVENLGSNFINKIWQHRQHGSRLQCGQIGRFLKVVGEMASIKSRPNAWWIFGLKWKATLLMLNFWKLWATFEFGIWSHWLQSTLNFKASSSFKQTTLFCLVRNFWAANQNA